jgi:hypothetical protein
MPELMNLDLSIKIRDMKGADSIDAGEDRQRFNKI